MIHPNALVDCLDSVGEGTNVWAYAHVMSGAKIGRDCNIGDHAFVESGAVIGDGVTVKNSVLVWEGVMIEDNVFVGPRVTFTNDRQPRSPRNERVSFRYQSKSDCCRRPSSVAAAPSERRRRFAPGLNWGSTPWLRPARSSRRTLHHSAWSLVCRHVMSILYVAVVKSSTAIIVK